jgi:hypothetical protein
MIETMRQLYSADGTNARIRMQRQQVGRHTVGSGLVMGQNVLADVQVDSGVVAAVGGTMNGREYVMSIAVERNAGSRQLTRFGGRRLTPRAPMFPQQSDDGDVGDGGE